MQPAAPPASPHPPPVREPLALAMNRVGLGAFPLSNRLHNGGRQELRGAFPSPPSAEESEVVVYSIFYIIGVVVVVLAILSFLGIA